MKSAILAIILAISVDLAYSQIPLGVVSGSCVKNPPTISDFKPDRYAGRWYEIQRMEYQFEKDLQCVTADYGLINSTAVTVKNTGFNM